MWSPSVGTSRCKLSTCGGVSPVFMMVRGVAQGVRPGHLGGRTALGSVLMQHIESLQCALYSSCKQLRRRTTGHHTACQEIRSHLETCEEASYRQLCIWCWRSEVKAAASRSLALWYLLRGLTKNTAQASEEALVSTAEALACVFPHLCPMSANLARDSARQVDATDEGQTPAAVSSISARSPRASLLPQF